MAAAAILAIRASAKWQSSQGFMNVPEGAPLLADHGMSVSRYVPALNPRRIKDIKQATPILA